MNSIKEAKRQLADLKARLKALNTKDTDETPLNDEENAEADDMVSRIGKLESRITRLEAAEDAAAEKAEEVDEDAEEKAFGSKLFKGMKSPIVVRKDEIRVPRQKGSAFGRYVLGRVVDKEFGQGAGKEYVEKHFGDTAVTKALTTATPFIPQDFLADPIELLREESVVRRFARTMAMPMGQMTIPRQRLGASAAWLGEAQDIAVSQAGFDVLQMTWKKLGAITTLTKELVEFSPIDAEGYAVKDLVAQMGLAEDVAFLTSAGSATVPKGIKAFTATANKFASNATVNFDNVNRDLRAAELALRGNLVRGKFVWIMAPGVEAFLKTLQNGFGQFPFADSLEQGKLLSYDVLVTAQLPTNLGGGTNQSDVYLVCADHVVVGDAYRMEVSITTEGSWIESAAQVNAFSRDLIGIKATNSVDLTMMHGVSAAVITTTGWSVGAGFNKAGFQYVTEAANIVPTTASAANPTA